MPIKKIKMKSIIVPFKGTYYAKKMKAIRRKYTHPKGGCISVSTASSKSKKDIRYYMAIRYLNSVNNWLAIANLKWFRKAHSEEVLLDGLDKNKEYIAWKAKMKDLTKALYTTHINGRPEAIRIYNSGEVSVRLRRCPFCGSKARVTIEPFLCGSKWHYVHCGGAHIQVGSKDYFSCAVQPRTCGCLSLEQAAQLWNGRKK